MLNNRLLVLFLLSFLAGCAATGPADDGYDNSNEWVDNGRLLAEDTKNIYSSAEPLKTDLNYSDYQQWQQAKGNNSAEYQKFKKWQEFEEYQRWKDQQKSE